MRSGKLSTDKLFKKVSVIVAVFVAVAVFSFLPMKANAIPVTYDYTGIAPYIITTKIGDAYSYDYSATEPLITGKLTIDISENFTGTVMRDDIKEFSMQSSLLGVTLDLNTDLWGSTGMGFNSEYVTLVNGNITNWELSLVAKPGGLASNYLSSNNIPLSTSNDDSGMYIIPVGYSYDWKWGYTMQSYDYTAMTYYNPGTWTRESTSSVPEPATMLLLGLGMVGLAGVKKKFKN